MDILWAPWRIDYITGAKDGPCVFCDAFTAWDSGSAAREKLVIHAGPQAAVVMNRFPYGHAHLLIVPRRHTADFAGLSGEEHAALTGLLQLAMTVLRDVTNPQGFNIGMNLGSAGGAGIVEHLHWHILPRWPGDVNALALISEVKSIPEHLLVTYDKLKAAFEARLAEPR